MRETGNRALLQKKPTQVHSKMWSGLYELKSYQASMPTL